MAVALQSIVRDASKKKCPPECTLRVPLQGEQKEALILALGVEVGMVCERIGIEAETIVMGFQFGHQEIEQISLTFEDETCATAFRTASRLHFV